jgi:hypothetical protein
VYISVSPFFLFSFPTPNLRHVNRTGAHARSNVNKMEPKNEENANSDATMLAEIPNGRAPSLMPLARLWESCVDA